MRVNLSELKVKVEDMPKEYSGAGESCLMSWTRGISNGRFSWH